MISVVKVAKDCYAITENGFDVEHRVYPEHAQEVVAHLHYHRKPPSEDRQLIRDGKPLVQAAGTATIVSERGRVPVREFASGQQAALWLQEYRRLCKLYFDRLQASPHTLVIRLYLHPKFMWAVFVDDVWAASFTNRSRAQRYLVERA